MENWTAMRNKKTNPKKKIVEVGNTAPTSPGNFTYTPATQVNLAANTTYWLVLAAPTTPANEMFNFRSPSFKQLGLEGKKLSDRELIELMLKEPRFVRRPVVRIGNKVYFGADVKVLENLIS